MADNSMTSNDIADGIDSSFKKRLKIYCIVILAILLYAVLSIIFNWFLSVKICPFELILGIPCPGCGMSRALFYAITLDFKKAFAMHPLFILAIAVFLLYTYLYLFKNKNIFLYKKAMYPLAAVLIITYIIRMIMFFPNTSPMEFNEKSIVGLIIKIFN